MTDLTTKTYTFNDKYTLSYDVDRSEDSVHCYTYDTPTVHIRLWIDTDEPVLHSMASMTVSTLGIKIQLNSSDEHRSAWFNKTPEEALEKLKINVRSLTNIMTGHT